MIVTVEQRHIALGLSGCETECPIALAIQEAIGQTVEVGWGTIICSISGDSQRMTWEQKDFMKTFDRGNQVHPGLQIEIPDEWEKTA